MSSTSSAPGSKPVRPNSGQAEPRGFSFSDPLLRHISPTVTAVMVDAAFFLARAQRIFGKLVPEEAARRLHGMALDHLNDGQGGHRVARLYRIFVYDAPPAAWKGHQPVSKQAIDLSESATAKWRRAFHEKLRGMRKVALRLGEIPTSQVRWELRPDALKDLINKRRTWDQLTDDDFRLSLRQKGVDMRLGLDIASVEQALQEGSAQELPARRRHPTSRRDVQQGEARRWRGRGHHAGTGRGGGLQPEP